MCLPDIGCERLDAAIPLPDNFKKSTPEEQLRFIKDIAHQVVEKMTLVEPAFLGAECDTSDDSVYNYARVLCHFGSLVMEFRDGWAEGDGDRVFRCWRLFMPHFKMAGSTKYSLEASKTADPGQCCSVTKSGASGKVEQVREHQRWSWTKYSLRFI